MLLLAARLLVTTQKLHALHSLDLSNYLVLRLPDFDEEEVPFND